MPNTNNYRHLLLFILTLIVIFWFIFPEEFMDVPNRGHKWR